MTEKPPASELAWTAHNNGSWTATGPTGTEWEITEHGTGGRFGITVARWDHPDWWAASLQEAKGLAAEIDARPPVPEEDWVVEKPVVEPAPGKEHVPVPTSLPPPPGVCRCGSAEPPVSVKPRRHTVEWWDDPLPFWRCPACGAYRGDVGGGGVGDSPGPLGPRFDRAFALARELHATQVRKGTGIPYVSHLMGVASLVLEDGGDEDEAIAALLHDAVEDQGGPRTLDRIRELFGERVAELVDACSDTDEADKPPWRARKEAYIAHLREPGLPAGAIRVSLADKLHNARAILFDLRADHDVFARFSAGREDQRWYYGELADTFAGLTDSPMATELRRVVGEIFAEDPAA
ncbi:MAG: HD domain-containing protein [Solirubrobacteraceae bacterium]